MGENNVEQSNVLLEFVVGTYEKFLLGYRIEFTDDDEGFALKSSFATQAHTQHVRCVASSDRYLASGGADEVIQLFDMKTRKEFGSLVHHNGTITSLEFYNSFLISCSDDKSIGVWSVEDCQYSKTLSGHKGTVNDISIHPSGKMLLSVSNDNTLRTWDLVKGRQAFVIKLKKITDFVQWSPNGEFFVLVQGNTLDIYTLEEATICENFTFEKKICCICFITDDYIAVGLETGHINFCFISTKDTHPFKIHDSRVKAVQCARVNEELFLITAASDGCVKVWLLDKTLKSYKPRRMIKMDTKCRPTCLTIIKHN